MDSRHWTRVGTFLGWRAASGLVRLALVFAAAAAPAPAADDLVPGDGRSRLRLVWCDVLRRTPFPFEVMSAEVERILGGERVDVTWRVVEGDAGIVDDSEIKVILLDRPPAKPARNHLVMGATPREGSSRTAWVYSSPVAWALGLTQEALLPLSQQQELARALGRVVAHEIVHVVAPAVPHQRRGLMQARMDRKNLLMPGLSLESAERRMFEAELASFSGEPAPLVRSAASATRRPGGVGPIESAPALPIRGGPGSGPLE